MRRGNCCTNQGESSRMYPARQMRSTLCSLRAATTARSCSSRARPFEGIASAVRPSFLAVVRPSASGLFEITTAMRVPGIFPAATLLAIASKFEPRPESRMPRFFMRSTVTPRKSRWPHQRQGPSPMTGKHHIIPYSTQFHHAHPRFTQLRPPSLKPNHLLVLHITDNFCFAD